MAKNSSKKNDKTRTDGARKKLGKAEYLERLSALELELNELQRWLQHTGKRMMVLVEGRDTAGKGGVIAALADTLNPRSCRVVALPKPDEPTPITSPEFTLFIGDADRLVAIQGRLDKSVVSYPWEGHLPVLEVVPVKLKADPQRELALFKNLPPLFEVHLSNPSPSAITGDLVYDTAVAPAALTPKRFGEVSREQIQTPGPATIKGQAGPVIRLTDAVAPGVRFWLAPARDAFQRAFVILPSPNSTFAFEQTNLEILINPAFVSSGSSASQSLTLKNTEEADITLKQLAASPWRGTAISEPSLTGKDALKKNVSQSFDLTGTADEWVVEMTLVRNSKTLLGVAVVKAAM